VRVRIRRRGGLAGITLSTELDTSELDDRTAAQVEQAVMRLLAASDSVSTPHPDAFQYEISTPASDSSVVVGEHELPSELEPLTRRLTQAGQVEPRSRPS
jgi:Emfourin